MHAVPKRESRSFPDAESVAMALSPSYPVFCLRPAVLEATARRFISQFPGTVLYAVKCNPHPLVLDAFYRAGVRHFDTASLPEIALIAETYSDAKAYFMHPVKGRAVIQSSYTVYGVRHYVVDHRAELDKVLEETGGKDIAIIVRIKTPPSEGTLYHLAAKFGADIDEAADLMREAKRRGCQVGICFHVGSQCRNPAAYVEALGLVGEVIEKAGFEPGCIDVGGGFPSSYLNMQAPPLDDYMTAIRAGLKSLALSPTLEVWAEPGRALAATGCSLLVQIQLRKGNHLYINDGIYGSLSEMVQVDIKLPARLIRGNGAPANSLEDFILAGPTCDSLDIMPGSFSLPADAQEGDWIEIDHIGAYSNSMATHFNGFHPETFVEVHDDPPGALHIAAQAAGHKSS